MREANPNRNRYLLTLPGVFRAFVIPDKDLFLVKGWIFFVPFRFNPFRVKKKGKGKARDTRKKKWRPGNIRMMKGAVRAFRIKRLEADIDTDDFTLNAWLVPVFSMVNRENVQLQVNFEGHHSLVLDLRVTLGTLLWIIIKTKYISTINH